LEIEMIGRMIGTAAIAAGLLLSGCAGQSGARSDDYQSFLGIDQDIHSTLSQGDDYKSPLEAGSFFGE
jgi:hypothetical protein